MELQKLVASGQLLTLNQAAKFTLYSAEYLGLLARKGRIRAFKLNRDWFITRSEILDYVKSQKRKTLRSLINLKLAEKNLLALESKVKP